MLRLGKGFQGWFAAVHFLQILGKPPSFKQEM